MAPELSKALTTLIYTINFGLVIGIIWMVLLMLGIIFSATQEKETTNKDWQDELRKKMESKIENKD